MAQYEVLRPIEFDGKLYLPKSDAEPPKTAKSAGNGLDIPVDASGVIELDPQVAAELNLGQVKAIPPKPKGAAKK